MGFGTKLKEALSGDKDRKDLRYNEESTQQAPGAYPSEDVPRSHHEASNRQWYASDPTENNDTYDLNEAVPEDSGYTYGIHRGFNDDNISLEDEPQKVTAASTQQQQQSSRFNGLRKHQPAKESESHRKSAGKDSNTMREEKNLTSSSTPYWGDSPTRHSQQMNRDSPASDTNYTNNDIARDTLVPRDEREISNLPSSSNNNKGGMYDLYNADGTHEQHQGRLRDERRHMKMNEGVATSRGDDFQSHGVGEPNMMYNTVDRTRRGGDNNMSMTDGSTRSSASGSGSGMRQGMDSGMAMGGRSSEMGDDHFGPGHSASRVLHRCDHCGNDNDISRYFRKTATYRME
ncbi:hypothetical protein F5Y16DRAFT_21980 [Xylariaceae sp. FL0255]|nr:hypothetical protein F5Y16DRAFT_21980 [Xylariaceae sp. FL0255]